MNGNSKTDPKYEAGVAHLIVLAELQYCVAASTYLWEAPRHNAKIDDLCVHVWNDEEAADGPLRSAITRINNAFLEQAIPIVVSKRKPYVTLTVS